MKLKVIVHEVEGGYWAEVLMITSRAIRGRTLEELYTNLYAAIDISLSNSVSLTPAQKQSVVLEIAL
ncbi:MAG: type II toxin-antitoxin system HicB family antitoxin [Armatimonadota bacterium]